MALYSKKLIIKHMILLEFIISKSYYLINLQIIHNNTATEKSHKYLKVMNEAKLFLCIIHTWFNIQSINTNGVHLMLNTLIASLITRYVLYCMCSKSANTFLHN